MDELRAECLTRHGLVNDEIRKKVWPILLNLDAIYVKDHGYPQSSIYKPGKST